MKKVLLFLAFVGFLVALYFYLKVPDSNPLYVSPDKQILPVSPPEKGTAPADPKITQAIQTINERNAKIKSMVCNDVEIHYSQAARVKVKGTIAMEKPMRFRMGVRSFLGEEMDLGSNDTHFWFWSKRMEPPVLHFAKHEDLSKSMLKTPLNPGWLMSSLNLGSVDAENAQLLRYKEFYGVLLSKNAPNGEPVTVLTLIKPDVPVVAGHYMYGQNGKMMASSEVKSHQQVGEHIIPKQMLIIWYQEGVSMTWELHGPQINVGINPSQWLMPSTRNAIDMGQTAKNPTAPPRRFRR